MTPDELVERVAEAMWMACDWGPMLKPYEEVRERDKRVIRLEARAAIALVLEEAALVCERRFMGDHTREDMEARRCAAAIRALIKKEPECK